MDFNNNVSKEIRKTPEIYYCGNNLSGTYLSQLIDVIGDRDFSVNIIQQVRYYDGACCCIPYFQGNVREEIW